MSGDPKLAVLRFDAEASPYLKHARRGIQGRHSRSMETRWS